MSEHLLALASCPDRDTAERIADALVEGGHAACVNLLPGLTSVYRWEGEIHHDAESLLFMKTTAAAFEGLRETILRHHPDTVPEIVAAPLVTGLDRYLAWVTEQTAGTMR